MLRAENVTITPLHGVEFAADAGELVKLVLPSPTAVFLLFSALTGTARPDQGRIHIGDRDVYALQEAEGLALFADIGVIPEEEGLLGNLKGWENISLPLWYHRRRNPGSLEERAREVLSELGAEEAEMHRLLSQLPERLSEGEQRLLVYTRVLLQEPALVLCAEPYASLDRGRGVRAAQALCRYQAAAPGRTLVCLFSDEDAARRFPGGRLVSVGEQ